MYIDDSFVSRLLSVLENVPYDEHVDLRVTGNSDVWFCLVSHEDHYEVNMWYPFFEGIDLVLCDCLESVNAPWKPASSDPGEYVMYLVPRKDLDMIPRFVLSVITNVYKVLPGSQATWLIGI